MAILLVANGIEGHYMHGWSQSDTWPKSKEIREVICICRSARVILIPLPKFRRCIWYEPEFTSDGENPLLFCKELGEPTTADLKLRLCT